ncbi:uncharacterized protein ACR2FA_005304 [Aphomia sociella]
MTNADTERILRQLLDKIVVEQNYKEPKVSVQAISSGGANYSSVLYNATISEPNKEEIQLFAKVAAIGEVARGQFHLPLFDIERFAYNELLRTYAKIQDKYNLSGEDRLVWPKFYGCNPNLYEETVVLENLAAKGFITYDRLKSIDWAYASKAVESLAKFHALSMAYGKEYPEEYAKVLDKMKFDPNSLARMNETFTKLVGMAINATKEENRDRLKKYMEKEGDLVKMVNFYQPTGTVLLTHGDYRMSNLMHRIKKDGSIEVTPVDYQTIAINSPVADLFYFIFTGSDEEFRRQHYEQLLEHYYKELSRVLHKLDMNPDEYYSKANYERDLKNFLPFGLIISILTLPIITVEAENAPTLQGDEGINNIAVAKTSNLYSERVNGIVNDFIRWGRI